MRIMKTISQIAAAGVMLVAAPVFAAKPGPATAITAATAQQTDATDGAFVSRSQFGETSGEAMYRRVCAACHMADAKGAVGAGMYPALANNSKLASSGYPLLVVIQGLNGMPALGKMMTDQQTADVVNYVRTHFGNRYKDKVTAEDAKALR